MRLPRNRRDLLQIAIVINQLATPGLGSWIAGRKLAGSGQLTLAFAGFLLFLVRCVRLVSESFRAALDGSEAPGFPAEAWQRALLLFGIAWLWSAVTSLQLLHEIRNLPAARPSPPVLR